MLEHTLEYLFRIWKDEIMHSELDFRPVQIITGHNSHYEYWPNESNLKSEWNIDNYIDRPFARTG